MFGFDTLLSKWKDKRIVCLCARYIWVGTLKSVDGPFVYLEDAKQVTNHGFTMSDNVREYQSVGPASVNLGMVEVVYGVEGAEWSKSADWTRVSTA